jgi:GT2 family glycosyltransferase
MKIIDIIILSFAKSDKHYNLTVNCIKSLKESKLNTAFNIIVVETNPSVNYDEFNVKTLHFDEPFNYNGFANKAIMSCDNELIGVFNNDVIFDDNWFTEIMKLGVGNTIDSLSPISLTSASQREFVGCKYPVAGYEIARHVSGWALVFTRELWLKIGGLSEIVNFWCSDDVYAKQLQEHGINHYLIPTSIVNHVENGSNTLKTLEADYKESLTYGQARIWNKEFNDNKFGLNGK